MGAKVVQLTESVITWLSGVSAIGAWSKFASSSQVPTQALQNRHRDVSGDYRGKLFSL